MNTEPWYSLVETGWSFNMTTHVIRHVAKYVPEKQKCCKVKLQHQATCHDFTAYKHGWHLLWDTVSFSSMQSQCNNEGRFYPPVKVQLHI